VLFAKRALLADAAMLVPFFLNQIWTVSAPADVSICAEN